MRRVFSRPKYIAIAVVTACFVFLFASFVTALPFLLQIVHAGGLGQTLSVSGSLLIGALTDAWQDDGWYLLALSSAIGINVSLLIFYKRLNAAIPSSTGLMPGITGGIVALLGFGCGACGTIFLYSLLTAIFGSGVATLLPFAGVEFKFVGIALILFSCVYLVRYINKPAVCPI